MMPFATDPRLTPPVDRLLEFCADHPAFTAQPLTIARAPGRLDVMGGIADYTGSLVCEWPLAAAAAAAVQLRDDGRIVCLSRQVEQAVDVPADVVAVEDPRDVRAAVDDSQVWSRYLLGAAWWIARRGRDITPGLTIAVDSDVPLGGGVSSSAAIEVSATIALAKTLTLDIDAMALAAGCQQIENHVVGAPCGVMDQVTSACGQPGQLLILHCQPDDDGQPARIIGHVPPPPGIALLGVNSGVRHEVSGNPYTDTRVSAFIAERIISVHSDTDPTRGYLANLAVRDYENHYRPQLPEHILGRDFLNRYQHTNDTVAAVDPDKQYRPRAAADHHVHEMARVQRFVDLMREASDASSSAPDVGDRSVDAAIVRAMVEAGRLMDQSHESYSRNAHLGHECTDRLAELARAIGPEGGVYGAKVTGGGSGGVVALLVRDDQHTRQRIDQFCLTYQTQTGRATQLFDGSGPGAAAFGAHVLDRWQQRRNSK